MKRFALLALALILCLAAPDRQPAGAAPLHQQPAAQLRMLDHLGGQPQHVVVRGTTAYVAGGYGLDLVDVRDPVHPALISHAVLDRPVTALAAANGYVYALSATALTTVDVRDPLRPTTVAACATCGGDQIAIAGPLLYVARQGGITIISLATPQAPAVVGGYITNFVPAVAAQGSLAFVVQPPPFCTPPYNCEPSLLAVLDMSNPALPRQIGQTALTVGGGHIASAPGYIAVGTGRTLQLLNVATPQAPVSLGSVDAGGDIVDIAFDGQHVVAVGGSSQTGTPPGFLSIFRINAGPPTLVSRLPLAWVPRQLKAGGGVAYVAGGAAGLRTIATAPVDAPAERAAILFDQPVDGRDVAADPTGRTLYATGYQELTIIDAADPRALRVRSGAATGMRGDRIAVLDGTAYVRTEINGIHVFDVNQPDRPRFLTGTWLQPERHQPATISGIAAGRTDPSGPPRLFALADTVVHADISDPAQPAVLPNIQWFSGTTLVVSGTTAYIAPDEVMGQGDQLAILNVADPTRIDPIALLNIAGYRRVAVGGSRLYLHGQTCTDSQTCVGRLRIIDVTDPRAPAELARYEGPDYAGYALHVSGALLYLMGADGLRVYDAADPTALRPAGTYHPSVPDYYRLIQRHGPYVYLGSSNRLEVLSLAQPMTPTLAYTQSFGALQDLAFSGRYMHLVDTPRLLTFDITNPTSPTLAGRYEPSSTGQQFSQVETSGTTVVLKRSGHSLAMIDAVDMTNPAAPQVLGHHYGSDWDTLVVNGNRLYMFASGFGIYNIAASSPFALLGVFSPGAPLDVRLSGQYGFVRYQNGLRALDLADTQRAVDLDYLSLVNPPVSANPTPTRLVELGGASLRLIDASDPRQLGLLSDTSWPPASGPCDATAADPPLLYAACASGHVLAYDLRNPRQPRVIAAAVLPDTLRSIALLDGALAVGGDTGVFTVSRPQGAYRAFLPGLRR